MSEKLLPCPCGKVPDHLSLSDNGQGGKWAQATCPECGEWSIEFRTDYNPLTECQGEALEAWNAAPRAQPEVAQAGWKPIAAAPKDGTLVILGFIPDEHGFTMPPCEGFFNRKLAIPEWVWMAAPKAPLYPQQPTHWMPLPEPPKETV